MDDLDEMTMRIWAPDDVMARMHIYGRYVEALRALVLIFVPIAGLLVILVALISTIRWYQPIVAVFAIVGVLCFANRMSKVVAKSMEVTRQGQLSKLIAERRIIEFPNELAKLLDKDQVRSATCDEECLFSLARRISREFKPVPGDPEANLRIFRQAAEWHHARMACSSAH